MFYKDDRHVPSCSRLEINNLIFTLRVRIITLKIDFMHTGWWFMFVKNTGT